MASVKPRMITVLAAVACAAAIFALASLSVSRIANSKLYRKSQILRSIASQDQLSIVTIVKDGEMRNVLVQFLSAVTNAYINFEMIPYNEPQTFVVLLQSMPPAVHIDNLRYHRRNLMIHGEAQTDESYKAFVDSLRESEYFHEVLAHSYLTMDDTVKFQLECVSAQYDGVPAFAAVA